MHTLFSCFIEKLFNPKRKNRNHLTCIIATAVVLGLLCGPQMKSLVGQQPNFETKTNLKRFEQTTSHMGVRFGWVVYAESQMTAEKGLRAATDRVEEIEQRLSDYRTESEVNRFCDLAAKNAHPKPVDVSADLHFVIDQSLRFNAISNGAFDCTVGPLTDLWRTARKTKRLPPAIELKLAQSRTGSADHLSASVLRNAEDGFSGPVIGHQCQLLQPGMRLDFGAIAKGYAADQAALVLKQHGIHSALIDASGDVRVTNPPPGKMGWEIAIRDVDASHDPATLTLSNCSVATSGDLEQFTVIGKQRFSHIVDPRSGEPLVGQRAATVIARDGTTADAMASVVVVLGEKRGIELVNQLPEIEARFAWRDADQNLKRVQSAGFER